MHEERRLTFDLERYVERVRSGPCFICGIVRGDRGLAVHHVVHGRQQGSAHVHWHVAALPPGVPYEEQQFRALMAETSGVLALTDDERRELAERIARAIADPRDQAP